MKKLKDIDKNHSFYSDEAIRAWKKRFRELEEEEKAISKRKRRNKASDETNRE